MSAPPPGAGSAPLMSILTCILNAREDLSSTARSLPAALPPWIEWVVVDGGSTDGSLEAARSDPRVATVVSGPDRGVYDAYNKALGLARGDYVYYLNAGDTFIPEALAEIRSSLEADRAKSADPGVVCFAVAIVGAGAIRVPEPGDLHLRMSVPTQGAFFPRRALAALGGFDLSFRVSADYDALLRLRVAGTRFTGSRTVIAKFRLGGLSTTHRHLGLFEGCVAQLRSDPQAWPHCLLTITRQALVELRPEHLSGRRARFVLRMARKLLWFE